LAERGSQRSEGRRGAIPNRHPSLGNAFRIGTACKSRLQCPDQRSLNHNSRGNRITCKFTVDYKISVAIPRTTPTRYDISFSLALRLHCGGCAASHANREKEIREYANRFRRASHDGGMDAGLRRRRRKLCSAPAATSSFHRGYGDAKERVGAARKYGDIFRHGNKHDGYECELECEWHGRREPSRLHHYTRRRVHLTRGSALARERANYGNKPCRRHEVRFGCSDGHE
jgi:hypothetical protein